MKVLEAIGLELFYRLVVYPVCGALMLAMGLVMVVMLAFVPLMCVGMLLYPGSTRKLMEQARESRERDDDAND